MRLHRVSDQSIMRTVLRTVTSLLIILLIEKVKTAQGLWNTRTPEKVIALSFNIPIQLNDLRLS